MERQSKGSRDLEAYCKEGQGPHRAVVPPKKKKELLFVIMWFVTGWQEVQVAAADRFASCHNGRGEWEAAVCPRYFKSFTLFLDYSSLSSESNVKNKIKSRAIPFTGLDRPWVFQVVVAPRFQGKSSHESGKVVSPTHRPPLSPGKYSWYSFLLGSESLRGHSEARRIMSMKNSNDTIGNQTSKLPACSTVPQPTASSRNPKT
jgi:hypothetical protein